jgi:MOSC domain-containing protein YiiM
MTGALVSVNVSPPRTVVHAGREVVTSIFKEPVAGRRRVEGVNVAGDAQADRRVHGGPDKAVYAYAIEDYRWWESELGRPLAPGTFGENLTTTGVDVAGAWVGDRWAVGTTVLEVSEPRIPCSKLAMKMGDPDFVRRFADAGRPGCYLRIVAAGELGPGDAVVVRPAPRRSVTIAAFAEIHRSRRGHERLLAADGVSEPWRRWAERGAGRDED